ncbi:hypothetical protein BDV26DRAFT_292633 [Aspergillus bertholletiae]|uniref:Uncharacterized protein n=1 Tax=Aspergillus bertholletiae TaxID=1226010 RepID=A0A5N7B8G2_9EURO|nr:hypothetical protein BDV26DRAFT_292633 [Aspergillus bertholletiae]
MNARPRNKLVYRLGLDLRSHGNPDRPQKAKRLRWGSQSREIVRTPKSRFGLENRNGVGQNGPQSAYMRWTNTTDMDRRRPFPPSTVHDKADLKGLSLATTAPVVLDCISVATTVNFALSLVPTSPYVAASMAMVKVTPAPSSLRWSVNPPLERIPVEEDPNSAPQVIFSPVEDSKSTLYFISNPDPGKSAPQVFVPDPNEKFLNPIVQGYDAYPPLPNDAVTPPPANDPTPNKQKWIWAVVTGMLFVIIVVAAVVGGVVGSRNAHKDSAPSDTTTAPTSLSSSNHPTSSLSTTSSPTSTSSTATPSQTEFGATVHMFANSTCGGTDDSFSVLNSNSQKCVVVPSDKRSIRVSQNQGCKVVTWSGSNCAGSSYRVLDTDCHSVLYAAVSVDC